MTEARAVLGVEIGGTKLQVALGRSDGMIEQIERGSVKVEEGAAGILAWLEKRVTAFLDKARQQNHPSPKAIGVGFGGPVESSTGRVLVSHQIHGWEGVALKQWFESRFGGLPTVVANDANAAGWAEYCRGAGRGTKNFAYINIGSGIGGALVIDGRLYDGQGRGAGEMGHTYAADWTAAAPGAVDKLEHLCSGWSIERRLRRAEWPKDTLLWEFCGGEQATVRCVALGQAAYAGDAYAIHEVEHVAAALGVAVSNLITLFHPEKLALGGGVALMGEPLFNPLRRYVDRHVFGPFQGRYEIVPCALEESVVLVGALLLAGEQ